MSKKASQNFKVKGQDIHGPGDFFYKTNEDPILLAALFELAFATGNREGYAEAVADSRKVKPK